MLRLLIMAIFFSKVHTNQPPLYNNNPQISASSPTASSIDDPCVIETTEHCEIVGTIKYSVQQEDAGLQKPGCM